MPFDALVPAKVDNKVRLFFQRFWSRTSLTPPERPSEPKTVLQKIGLIPVPAMVLQHHKDRVAAEWQSKPMRAPRGAMRWYEYYQANSRLRSKRTDDSGPTPAHNDVLKAVQGQGISGVGTRRIPQAVYAIADAATRRAQQAGIETERVAGFFYIDPYVSLVYEEDGEVKHACLAIWDDNKVLHIATLT